VQESLASLNISQSSAESAADMLDPRAILEYFANFIAGLAEALGNVFLIFFIILFSLFEAFNMPAKITAELKAGNEYVERLANFANDLRSYVSIIWDSFVLSTRHLVYCYGGMAHSCHWKMAHSYHW
jgi:predicted PurR-regulated permease PerM